VASRARSQQLRQLCDIRRNPPRLILRFDPSFELFV
jgi:hypothetical protein